MVRRPRQAELSPLRVHIEPRRVSVRGPTSPMALVYTFFAVIMIGAIILMFPASSETGEFTSIVDTTFTATSAISGTGLVIVDTADAWSPLGEAVIAVLIFIGGLGFMTAAVFLIFVMGQSVGLQGQLVLGAGLGETQLGSITRLARRIILLAVVAQVIGAILIFIRWHVFGPAWEGLTLQDAIWQSVFTSISAFNNSGFDIIPDSLAGGPSVVGFANDIPTLSIIAALILIGSTSYTSFADFGQRRSWRLLRLDSKLVFLGTGIMLLIGFAAFLTLEWSNPNTVGDLPVDQKITHAAFHTSNRTSGFSALDYSELRDGNVATTEGLMLVGGASATTAGGIKVNTFMVLLFAAIATIRGKTRTNAFGREISRINVRRAFVVGASSIAMVTFLVFLLFMVQPDLNFREALFETVSAFGTTGWSLGITSELNTAGRIIISIAMFVGRFGPLTVALFMAGRESTESYRFPQEQLRIG